MSQKYVNEIEATNEILHKCVKCSYLWSPSKRTRGKDVVKCPSCQKHQIPKVIQLPPPESISPQEAIQLATELGPIDFAKMTPKQIAVYENHLSKVLSALGGQGA